MNLLNLIIENTTSHNESNCHLPLFEHKGGRIFANADKTRLWEGYSDKLFKNSF